MGAEAKGNTSTAIQGVKLTVMLAPASLRMPLTHANKTCCAPSRAVHVKRLGTHLRLRMP